MHYDTARCGENKGQTNNQTERRTIFFSKPSTTQRGYNSPTPQGIYNAPSPKSKLLFHVIK